MKKDMQNLSEWAYEEVIIIGLFPINPNWYSVLYNCLKKPTILGLRIFPFYNRTKLFSRILPFQNTPHQNNSSIFTQILWCVFPCMNAFFFFYFLQHKRQVYLLGRCFVPPACTEVQCLSYYEKEDNNSEHLAYWAREGRVSGKWAQSMHSAR